MEHTILTYIVISIALYLVTSLLRQRLQNGPPCPFPCLPIMGHLYLMKHPITTTYTKLTTRYGPVLLIYLGSRPDLVISSATVAEECLTKNDVVFCNRPSRFFIGKYMGYEYTSMNFAPYGSHWRNLRKIAAVHILSPHRLRSLAFVRDDEVRALVKRLFNKCETGRWECPDLKPLFLDTNLNIMIRVLFGNVDLGVNHEPLKRIVGDTVRLLNTNAIGELVTCLRWLNWMVEREFREFSVKRETLLRELIENHRRSWELNTREGERASKPMIQVLLELQESDPNYYKDELIHGIIMDLLTGASETTASTMEWALSLLLNHQEVLKKAKAEIDNNVGHERFLDESDLSNLPYLRCIINETLRMYPAAPFLLPRESSNDCVVGGYRIPRGTMLQINAHAIQNDPQNWDDPTSFRPDRFVRIEGHRVAYKFFPFGAGRRSCPGEGLAIRVISLTIGSLIQCFEWERIDCDKLVDMNLFESVNMQRAKPLEARIKPRQVMMNLFQKL